ncbi:hypothetical protein SPRG_11285 [Saprolegnia parasitica CBS 223.65]|uniref:Uncharacterized protein n=1 Tax=Saprolegnia parasitica (strain CBS 223.65) TaxID=695850 RepID=A0A067BZA2_SAPPC|nr:hypothetical protein SPRG_11285 [Saprolegnia parasitica CBS 223.65]KDO23854.1 hypothetical protein SPRG_11285 [Saprolegnia parasitica CBS 223.65]|eukprot:XP_012205486.1 hypothetical protein SPRG_11285 [Saprolegnia parasitica CBS 223.65]
MLRSPIVRRSLSLFSDPFNAKSWEVLRPSSWHPLVSLEHSLHELKGFGRDKIMYAAPHVPGTTASASEESEFFKDLPNDTSDAISGDAQPFANYSYSSAVIVDKNGKRLASTRRRYEDSTGRLKATHTREIGDKRVLTKWNRVDHKDKGQYETVCDSGSADEFETLWATTEFGFASKELEDEGPPQKGKAPELKEKAA